MKNPMSRRMWVVFRALILVLLAAGLYAVGSIRETREALGEMAGGGEEAGAVVSEMKARSGGIGEGASSYAETDEPGYREQVAGERAGFEEAKARYDALISAEGDLGRGEEVQALYVEYAPSSEALMKRNDEQEAAKAAAYAGFDEVEGILDAEMREKSPPRSLAEFNKVQEAAKMSAASGVENSLTSYLKELDESFLELGASSAKDFREGLGRYRRLNLKPGEKQRTDRLEAAFGRTTSGVNNVVALDGSLRADEQNLLGLRARLDGLLNEEVQARKSREAAGRKRPPGRYSDRPRP